MASGHASHKGPAIKHSHDTGQINTASDLTVEPENIIDEGGYPFDEQGAENPAATERPQQENQED